MAWVGGMDEQGTEARYEAELAIDLVSNRVVERDRGQHPITTAVKWTLGVVVVLGALVNLILGLWPVTFLGLLGAVWLFVRPKPKIQFVGLWQGRCPLCADPIWIHAPPKAENFRFRCPNCTQGVILRGGRFEASEVTA